MRNARKDREYPAVIGLARTAGCFSILDFIGYVLDYNLPMCYNLTIELVLNTYLQKMQTNNLQKT